MQPTTEAVSEVAGPVDEIARSLFKRQNGDSVPGRKQNGELRELWQRARAVTPRGQCRAAVEARQAVLQTEVETKTGRAVKLFDALRCAGTRQERLLYYDEIGELIGFSQGEAGTYLSKLIREGDIEALRVCLRRRISLQL